MSLVLLGNNKNVLLYYVLSVTSYIRNSMKIDFRTQNVCVDIKPINGVLVTNIPQMHKTLF